MPLIIGLDEAGYGPNLGPLVISATVWEVPIQPQRCDLWQRFADVVSQSADDEGRLHIADSKQVYSPAKGLSGLELGVMCGLLLSDQHAGSFHGLWERLSPDSCAHREGEPWFAGEDLPLPVDVDPATIEPHWLAWQDCCQKTGIRLRGIYSDIVLTERFNKLTLEHQSKGRALSHLSLNLLARAWSMDADPHALVIFDKHGGRNRYHELLPLAVADRFIICRAESTPSSRYTVDQAEIRFEMQAERYLPVALASMVSKYLRELSMRQFNRFWKAKLPDLRATAGYPGDSRRFYDETAACRAEIGVSDAILWRDK